MIKLQTTDPPVAQFLTEMAQFSLPGTTNPYAATKDPECPARARLRNLELYLSYFRKNGCPVLLVGEAFGYRGGRVTGIPFTSEWVVINNHRFREWFPEIRRQYRRCAEPGALSREATATIAWKTFAEFTHPPCCWNIVPVHPYDQSRGIWSNRGPTAGEVAAGAPFTQSLIGLLNPGKIIAVGRFAGNGLTKMDIEHATVRHPSQGGATHFRDQILALLQDIPQI